MFSADKIGQLLLGVDAEGLMKSVSRICIEDMRGICFWHKPMWLKKPSHLCYILINSVIDRNEQETISLNSETNETKPVKITFGQSGLECFFNVCSLRHMRYNSVDSSHVCKVCFFDICVPYLCCYKYFLKDMKPPSSPLDLNEVFDSVGLTILSIVNSFLTAAGKQYATHYLRNSAHLKILK